MREVEACQTPQAYPARGGASACAQSSSTCATAAESARVNQITKIHANANCAPALCSKTVRKNIACVLTVISQNQREAVREAVKDKKRMPLDLRPKKTRAIRRALSVKQVRRPDLTAVTLPGFDRVNRQLARTLRCH